MKRIWLHVVAAVLVLAAIGLVDYLNPTAYAACPPEDLVLVDATCTPPHGGGPDGRVWVQLVCTGPVTAQRVPFPYDWQLAELSGGHGNIFAWDADPTFAYVEGAAGSYQASALTFSGQLSFNLELPAGSCSLTAPARRKSAGR